MDNKYSIYFCVQVDLKMSSTKTNIYINLVIEELLT